MLKARPAPGGLEEEMKLNRRAGSEAKRGAMSGKLRG